MITNNQLIDFQGKINVLKRLHRTGWCMRHVPNAETVAAHSWRMALMAIQKEADLKAMGVNVSKVIEMCLLHDVAEAAVGDIVPEHEQKSGKKITKEEKNILETNAIHDFSMQYDFPKLLDLFNEYERQETMEAKVVKNLDKMDMLIQAFEYMTSYPELSGMHDFMNYDGKNVNLPFLLDDFQELKNRQAGHPATFNPFVDFQMVAGKLKHLSYSILTEGEETSCDSVAGHAFRTAVMALHLENNLKEQGLNVPDVVKIAVVYDVAHSAFRQKEDVDLLAKRFNVPFVVDCFNSVQNAVTPEAVFVKDLAFFERILQAEEGKQISSNSTSAVCISNQRECVSSDLVLNFIDTVRGR